MTIVKLLAKNQHWKSRDFTDTIVLHHAKASQCTIIDIDRWHKEDNHWEGGCGYHFLVGKDGQIYEGRPINIEGAHCPGWNNRSIGICFEGDFDQEKMSFTQEQKGIELIRWIRGKYKTPLQILRHKDALPGYTCPGENFRNVIIMEGSRDNMDEIKTVDEALLVLVTKKIIESPDYWLKVLAIVKFFDVFIIKVANALK
jgi:hypothetical protein